MNSIEIWNDMGNIYLKANDMHGAIDAYNKALEQGYQSGELLKNLAGAYVSQGNFPESIPLFEKSIELLADEGEKALVYTRIGDCYRRMGDYENSILAFKNAIEMEPGNPALCVGMIELQRELEKLFGFETEPPQTVPVFEEGIESEPVIAAGTARAVDSSELPTLGESANGAATVEPGLEQARSQADLEIASAAQDDENLAQNLFKNLDSTVVMSENTEKVNAPLDYSVSIASTFEDVGHTRQDNGNTEVNSEENRENMDGVRVTMLLTLGIMHWRNGSLEDAEGILQSAIDVAVQIKSTWFEALAWHSMALVKTALGDVKAAIHAYLRAMELAPDQIFPWNNLGTLYGNMGSHDKAMEAFQKAIRLYPEDSASWDGLGDIYTKLGRLDDAISAYQLGNVFDKHAQGGDAIKVYEKALDFYKMTFSSFEEEVVHLQLETQDETEEQPCMEAAMNLDEFSQLNLNPDALAKFANRVIVTDPFTLYERHHPVSEDDVLPEEIWTDGTAETELEESPVENQPAVPENLDPEPVQEGSAMVLGSTDGETGFGSFIAASQADESTTVSSQAGVDEEPIVVHFEGELAVDGNSSLDLNNSEQEPQAWSPATLVEEPAASLSPVVADVESAATEDHQDEEQLPEMVAAPSAEVVEPSLDGQVVYTREPESASQLAAMSPVATVPTAFDPKESLPVESPLEEGLPPVVTVGPPLRKDPARNAGTIASYEAVVRENPRNIRAWDSLGHLYRITQRYGEAIHAFERAVSLEPMKSIYHFQLGTLYGVESRYEEAIAEMEKVLEMDPGFYFAHCALGSYMRRLGRLEEYQMHITAIEPFMYKEKEYDQACYESICGHVDKAIQLLALAIEKQQTTLEYIRRDCDFDFIRQDPHYQLFEKKYSQNIVQY